MKIGDTVKLHDSNEKQAYMTLLHSQGFICKWQPEYMTIRIVGYRQNASQAKPTEYDSEVGKRLRKLRNDFLYSQSEVAEAIGITRRQVAMWETGNSIPTNAELDMLEDMFFTTKEYILRGVTNGGKESNI